MQSERVGFAVDALLAIAGPADDRIEDRADVRPDRRVPGPEEIAPGDVPGPRLGAEERDRRPRLPVDQRDLGHSAIPSIATADISASLSPGAQAMIGLPWLRPSPARKSLTYPPASLTRRMAARQSHAFM